MTRLPNAMASSLHYYLITKFRGRSGDDIDRFLKTVARYHKLNMLKVTEVEDDRKLMHGLQQKRKETLRYYTKRTQKMAVLSMGRDNLYDYLTPRFCGKPGAKLIASSFLLSPQFGSRKDQIRLVGNRTWRSFSISGFGLRSMRFTQRPLLHHNRSWASNYCSNAGCSLAEVILLPNYPPTTAPLPVLLTFTVTPLVEQILRPDFTPDSPLEPVPSALPMITACRLRSPSSHLICHALLCQDRPHLHSRDLCTPND